MGVFFGSLTLPHTWVGTIFFPKNIDPFATAKMIWIEIWDSSSYWFGYTPEVFPSSPLKNGGTGRFRSGFLLGFGNFWGAVPVKLQEGTCFFPAWFWIIPRSYENLGIRCCHQVGTLECVSQNYREPMNYCKASGSWFLKWFIVEFDILIVFYWLPDLINFSMVVSGSPNRWDRWHFWSPNCYVQEKYHLYTTYIPCRTWGVKNAT